MRNSEFESRMRACEYFHDLRVPLENWTILRLDGRGFSRFTADRFEKPFDQEFHELMTETTRALMTEFHALLGYTESDEISLLLPMNWDFFDREVEKTLSISAAVASGVFSLSVGQAVQFDSRIWISGKLESVVDYFCWRQNDATRCALNGWAYWKLREEGMSAQQATVALEGQTSSQKQELLFQRGVNFNDLPDWQKRGVLLKWGRVTKEGFNPVTQEKVEVQRRALEVCPELPYGDEYREFLQAELAAHLQP